MIAVSMAVLKCNNLQDDWEDLNVKLAFDQAHHFSALGFRQ